MPPELMLEERSLSGAYMEGESPASPDMEPELDELWAGAFDKRTPLRKMRLPKSVLNDKCVEESDDKRQLKRRQMRKDLHKLKRCIARTGAAAVAASMLNSSIDGVYSMDQASRFRRQHRPPIPELSPELYVDGEPDFGTVNLYGHAEMTSDIKEVGTRRSYRDSILDEDVFSKEVSDPSTVASGLTLTDWDRLSEMSEIGSEAGFGECETLSLGGSDLLFDWDTKHDAEAHCRVEECHSDFITCLDSISRFRRPSGTKEHRVWTHRQQVFKGNDGAGGVFDKEGTEVHAHNGQSMDENELDDKVDPSTSRRFETGLGTAASGVLAMTQNAASRTAACCREAASNFASILGEPPHNVIGNFLSLHEVRLATQRAMSGDAEERHIAKIFLCCTLSFLVLLTLSFFTIALVVVAFVSTPDAMMEGQETNVNDGGMIDATGHPKSVSRVLTVVMISLFAGNGLAISHPMRDAILAGI